MSASHSPLEVDDDPQGPPHKPPTSNLNRLDVDQLDDTDQERVETARDLLEKVSLLTRPADSDGADARADS